MKSEIIVTSIRNLVLVLKAAPSAWLTRLWPYFRGCEGDGRAVESSRDNSALPSPPPQPPPPSTQCFPPSRWPCLLQLRTPLHPPTSLAASRPHHRFKTIVVLKHRSSFRCKPCRPSPLSMQHFLKSQKCISATPSSVRSPLSRAPSRPCLSANSAPLTGSRNLKAMLVIPCKLLLLTTAELSTCECTFSLCRKEHTTGNAY